MRARRRPSTVTQDQPAAPVRVNVTRASVPASHLSPVCTLSPYAARGPAHGSSARVARRTVDPNSGSAATARSRATSFVMIPSTPIRMYSRIRLASSTVQA